MDPSKLKFNFESDSSEEDYGPPAPSGYYDAVKSLQHLTLGGEKEKAGPTRPRQAFLASGTEIHSSPSQVHYGRVINSSLGRGRRLHNSSSSDSDSEGHSLGLEPLGPEMNQEPAASTSRSLHSADRYADVSTRRERFPVQRFSELQVPGPSTRTVSTKGYHAAKREADRRFGVRQDRPQNQDMGMLKEQRRINLGDLPPTPFRETEYAQQLAKTLQAPIPVQEFSDSYAWAGTEEELNNYAYQFGVMDCDIIAVDFEFHNTDTYDGFICVGSMSTSFGTLVFDCLDSMRGVAREFLRDVLTDPRKVKIFCGGENDVLRLRKNFDITPILVVDVQQMFINWISQSWDSCLGVCRPSLIRILQNAGKGRRRQEEEISQEEIEEKLYRMIREKPGLSFLAEVFGLSIDKDKALTLADWRYRIDGSPHPALLQYAAKDSFATIKIFYGLAEKIGESGLRRAAESSLGPLFKPLTVTQHKPPKRIPVTWTEQRLVDWRNKIAVLYDFNPRSVLRDEDIEPFAEAIEKGGFSEDYLQELLIQYNCPHDIAPSAHILGIYVDRDQTRFRKFASCICHNCNLEGHPAKHCGKDKDKAKAKACLLRPENRTYRLNQFQRRWRNYAAKRGWDPETHPIPAFMRQPPQVPQASDLEGAVGGQDYYQEEVENDWDDD